jgi:hypothetical protein
MSELEVRKIRVKNPKDIDVCIRDFLGHEYILFPHEEKEVDVLVKKNGRRHERQ